MAENITFDAPAYTARGTARERVSLPETVFDGTVNMPVMHQAVKAFLANQRQANAHTKTRGLVIGGNKKPWKQKGTGRARQGSTRAPHWVGGGTVFGPTNERNYKEDVPRQIRQLARKSAFNARARENAIFVVDAFNFDAPKTRRMLDLLAALGVEDQKVLVLTDSAKPAVFLSARNIPNAHVMPYTDVSTYHILWSDVVIIESSALGQSLDAIVEAEPEPAAAKAASKAAAKKTAAKKSAAKTSAAEKSAAKKSAAKKSAAKKSAAKKSAAKTPAKRAAKRKES